MKLCTRIYEVTGDFPDQERYGLIDQMRRSAVSIPSNIAEGHGRDTSAYRSQFYSVSLGSLNELETQLRLAFTFAYLNNEDHVDLSDRIEEVGKMLLALIRSTKKSDS